MRKLAVSAGRYIRQCASLSFRQSWATTTGLVGTILAGAVVAILGPIEFLGGSFGSWAQAGNGAITTAVYAAGAWAIIFVLRTIFISPFQLWADSEQRHAKKELRLALGELLSAGSAIMNQLLTDRETPYSIIAPKCEEWGNKVEKLLNDNLDASYVARLQEGSELPPVELRLGDDLDRKIERQKLWLIARVYVSRMQEFIREMSND